jgi:hypothetical protein
MGDIGRHLQADTVLRLPGFIQPYLLLLLDLRLYPRLLLIVARHRRTQVHHQQPGVAVNLHLGIAPRQQRVQVHPTRVGILNERARITVCDVVPPLRSSSPLRCVLSSSRNWLG